MPKKKDPQQEQLETIKTALEEGKTSLDLTAPSPEALALACQVTTLTDLEIGGNCPVLPPEIGNLTELTSLNIRQSYGEKLRALPKEIGKLVKLTRFYIYDSAITALPDTIENLVALENLTVWDTKLAKVPAGIGALQKLSELGIKGNPIASLPKELGHLANLVELDLEGNQLTDLPADLSGLKKLRELKLGRNKLATFPAGICTLPVLELLDLENNKIAKLPPELAQLRQLRELAAPENKITALPVALFDMSIAVLKLNSNQIAELPKAIGKMKKLVELDLADNPIANIPEDIVKAGKDAMFEHLGLSQARVVDDVPDAKVVAAKKEAIDQFVRGTKRRMTDEKMRDAMVAFLTGKSSKVPAARLDDHYSFRHICEALSPYDQWTFFDRRILAFITQAAWDFKQPGHDYDTGYHNEFFQWVTKQLETETDDKLFGKIADELVAQGLDKGELVRRAFIELKNSLTREDTGALTSFGRWLFAAADPKALSEVATSSKPAREALLPAMMQHAPALFERLAPQLMALTPDEDGEIHIPDEALTALCKNDPKRWEALLVEALDKIGDCMPCNANAARLLAENYPHRRDQARELAVKILARISERRNKEDRYQFHWGPDGWDEATASYIKWMLERFGASARPAIERYATDTKEFRIDVAEVVAKALGQSGIDIVAEGLDMTVDSDDIAAHFRRMFALLAPLDWSKYYDKAWELAQCEFKTVRQVAALAISKLPAAMVVPKARDLLSAKKSHQREGGALILGLLDVPEARPPLNDLLAGERSDDVRDHVALPFYRTPKTIDRNEVKRRVGSAKQRGKLEAPVAKWLDEKKLPPLAWAGGSAKVDAETVRYLFQRQTRSSEIAADPEVRDVYPLIARNDELGGKLLPLIVKNGGASAKNRFALSVLGLLGDDSAIEPLEELAIEGKNLNAVNTIALLGSKEAARALDRIARVFRTKYPNVREAAQDGFASIAEAMGLTPFELADQMLPDFGFEDHARELKVGKRKLVLVIGDDRKLALTENGAVLKTPPKDLTAKHKEELDELRTEIKEAARQLRASLEYYLIIQRRWSAADWKAFFLGNPLARAFAKGLLWGTFDGRKRTQTFRVTSEDATLIDAGGKKVAVSGSIGLIHPLDLSPAERDAWAAQLPEPPFPQLTRPVFTVGDDERGKKLSYRFENKTASAGTFKSRAERLGWRRGSVVDGGGVSAYRKLYPTDQIEVFVRIEGMNVTMDFESETTLQDCMFVKAGSIVVGSYTYDEPSDEEDPRLIALGDVPAIVFSETIADLGAIVRQKTDDE